jgi:hypothetical protein
VVSPIMVSSTELPASLNDISLPEELPPVVLIAFIRPDLLEGVLVGLSQQSLLPKQIIAFVDGMRSVNDQPFIEQSISLLKNFSHIVPVNVVTRSHNLGCDQNVILGLTEVLSSYDALVYLEDDTIPNKYFYDRMCRLLEAYREYKQIFSVSAYSSLPESLHKLIDTDFEVSNRVFSWGFGIWADRWNEIDLVNQVKQFNPFGSFYKIPATLQTKMTMVNQFWLEKNNQTDWVISMTLAALYRNKVHIVPKASFVRNVGFGHPQAKTYNQRKAQELSWVNFRYDASACPNSLPSSLELPDILEVSLKGTELAHHLSKDSLWLNPSAILYLLQKYPGFYSTISLIKLFMIRIPCMLRRLRKGLPI